MYKFGSKSKAQLQTCHKDIQLILNEVIKYYDFSVLEGIRTVERQQELFNSTPPRTTLDGINKLSKHQGKGDNQGHIVSFAVDIMPYKKGTNAFSGNFKDLSRFYYLMGMVRAVSERLLKENLITHRVRFGLDWNNNDVFSDQNFDDLPHFELIK